jgi:hypothetical protein
MPIPNNISLILLPKPNLNVLDLCRFSIPSSPKTLPVGGPPLLLSYSDTELFSNRVSMVGEGHVAFLQSLPRPSSKHSRNDLVNNKEISIHSILYCHNAMDIHLPLWVLEYWKAADKIHEEKLHWQPAIEWLRRKNNLRRLNCLAMGLPITKDHGKLYFRSCTLVLREMAWDQTY